MTIPRELHTERLLLRRWRAADRQPFAEQNADPRVMQFFPGCLNREESDALITEIEAHFAVQGYGWWALELEASGAFIGYVGLQRCDFPAPFTPAVAIGWRLGADYWEEGYACEAAEAALAFAFQHLGLDEVVAFTVPANTHSLGLMQRLGMARDPRDDFQHPHLPPGHALRHHVLYRLSRARWQARDVTG
ncbi:MAG: GNAT family N-acetyltransferase [Pseudomonadota bacterium]